MEIGRRFGRWVTEGAEVNKRVPCACDCGTRRTVHVSNLCNGSSTSCGCRQAELLAERRKHGHATGGKVTPTFHSYRNMLERCTLDTRLVRQAQHIAESVAKAEAKREAAAATCSDESLESNLRASLRADNNDPKGAA